MLAPIQILLIPFELILSVANSTRPNQSPGKKVKADESLVNVISQQQNALLKHQRASLNTDNTNHPTTHSPCMAWSLEFFVE